MADVYCQKRIDAATGAQVFPADVGDRYGDCDLSNLQVNGGSDKDASACVVTEVSCYGT